MIKKNSREFKESPSLIVNDSIDEGTKKVVQTQEQTNKKLDSIQKIMVNQLYFMKDSADDNKKIVEQMQVDADEAKRGGRLKDDIPSKVPKAPKGGRGALIPLGLPSFGKILKGAGIAGAIYGLGKSIVDGIDDYKGYMNISPKANLDLRGKITASIGGVINGFSSLVEFMSGGTIKLFDSKDVFSTIEKMTLGVQSSYNNFMGKFPKIKSATDYMFDGLNDVLDLTGDALSSVGKFLFEKSKIQNLKDIAKSKARLDELNKLDQENLTEEQRLEIAMLESQIKKSQTNVNELRKEENENKIGELSDRLTELQELAKEYEEGSILARIKLWGLYSDGMKGLQQDIKKTTFQKGQAVKGRKDYKTSSSSASEGTFLKKLGKVESGDSYGAENKFGYAGKYQFGKSTARPYLKKLGVSWEDYKRSPEIQEQLVRMFTDDNRNALIRAGIEPTELNMWMAHNQGVGGTKQILSGNVSDKVRRNISTNLPEGGSATASNYIQQWSKKFSNSSNVRAVSNENYKEQVNLNSSNRSNNIQAPIVVAGQAPNAKNQENITDYDLNVDNETRDSIVNSMILSV